MPAHIGGNLSILCVSLNATLPVKTLADADQNNVYQMFVEHLIYSSSCIKLVITSELSSQFHSPLSLSIPVSCSLKIHNCIQ